MSAMTASAASSTAGTNSGTSSSSNAAGISTGTSNRHQTPPANDSNGLDNSPSARLRGRGRAHGYNYDEEHPPEALPTVDEIDRATFLDTPQRKLWVKPVSESRIWTEDELNAAFKRMAVDQRIDFLLFCNPATFPQTIVRTFGEPLDDVVLKLAMKKCDVNFRNWKKDLVSSAKAHYEALVAAQIAENPRNRSTLAQSTNGQDLVDEFAELCNPTHLAAVFKATASVCDFDKTMKRNKVARNFLIQTYANVMARIKFHVEWLSEPAAQRDDPRNGEYLHEFLKGMCFSPRFNRIRFHMFYQTSAPSTATNNTGKKRPRGPEDTKLYWIPKKVRQGGQESDSDDADI